MKVLLDDNSTLPCGYKDSACVDKDHNYVKTGNLKLSITIGPKYHDKRIADYQKTKESIITGIKSFLILVQ